MTDTTKLLDGFEDWLAKWEKTMGEKHLFHDVAAFARIFCEDDISDAYRAMLVAAPATWYDTNEPDSLDERGSHD